MTSFEAAGLSRKQFEANADPSSQNCELLLEAAFAGPRLADVPAKNVGDRSHSAAGCCAECWSLGPSQFPLAGRALRPNWSLPIPGGWRLVMALARMGARRRGGRLGGECFLGFGGVLDDAHDGVRGHAMNGAVYQCGAV